MSADTLMLFDATYYVLYVKNDVPDLDKLLIIPKKYPCDPFRGGFYGLKPEISVLPYSFL